VLVVLWSVLLAEQWQTVVAVAVVVVVVAG
jgi:hypothetical protein